MTIDDRRSQTFAEKVLALLDEKFPWLGRENDEPVSGAETVDELATVHRAMVDQLNTNHKSAKN